MTTGNKNTYFEFVDGKILNYGLFIKDPGVLSLVEEVKTILRSTIEQNSLSGKIELNVFSDRATIAYINIIPVEFTAILMELVAKSDSEDHFSKN